MYVHKDGVRKGRSVSTRRTVSAKDVPCPYNNRLSEGFKGNQQLVCAAALLPRGFLEGFKGNQQLAYAVSASLRPQAS